MFEFSLSLLYIQLNNLKLTPQVVYTFRITGIDELNRTSETQNVTITFRDGEIKTQRKDSSDGVSLLLYVPATIYVDMELLAVAEVIFCEPSNDYTFQWFLGNVRQTRLNGKVLQLPANYYTSETQTNVEVKIVNANGEVMGSVSVARICIICLFA